MIKYISLFSLIFACSNSPPNIKMAVPQQTTLKQHFEDEMLSTIQIICLSQGNNSLQAGKKLLKNDKCKNDTTLDQLYNLSSGVGETDGLKTISAIMLRCLVEVNDLSKENVEKVSISYKQIINSTELKALLNLKLNNKSCYDIQTQTDFVKGGFDCGFINSISSKENIVMSMSLYIDAAKSIEIKLTENQMIEQAAFCYQESVRYLYRTAGQK